MYECALCQMVFPRGGVVGFHLNTSHPDRYKRLLMREAEEVDLHVCQACTSSFCYTMEDGAHYKGEN